MPSDIKKDVSKTSTAHRLLSLPLIAAWVATGSQGIAWLSPSQDLLLLCADVVLTIALVEFALRRIAAMGRPPWTLCISLLPASVALGIVAAAPAHDDPLDVLGYLVLAALPALWSLCGIVWIVFERDSTKRRHARRHRVGHLLALGVSMAPTSMAIIATL